jgi:predicted HAD superfamily Cof-like phosphohydrolase
MELDSLYVIIGTAVSYGIDIERVFDEVHRSNMTKVWPDGTVHYDEHGKVLKPLTYSRADITEALR